MNGTVLTELADAENRIAVAREDLTKANRRTTLQTITAPVDGTVQQLAVHTLGGVVQPAEPLMVIVPDAGGLVVEATVLNKDVGFVAEGQEVAVKVEAFPFTDYGLVPGRLARISRDAVEDEQLGLVYTARVELDCDEDGGGGGTDLAPRPGDPAWLCARLAPGLATQAEIKTGTRRIIDYLLSPIAKAAHDAGRER